MVILALPTLVILGSLLRSLAVQYDFLFGKLNESEMKDCLERIAQFKIEYDAGITDGAVSDAARVANPAGDHNALFVPGGAANNAEAIEISAQTSTSSPVVSQMAYQG